MTFSTNCLIMRAWTPTPRGWVQEVNAVTDNAAVLQQRVTKATNPFLAPLAKPGEAQFLTVLKPCSILLPHTHQRANEFYTVLFGTSVGTSMPLTCSVRV